MQAPTGEAVGDRAPWHRTAIVARSFSPRGQRPPCSGRGLEHRATPRGTNDGDSGQSCLRFLPATALALAALLAFPYSMHASKPVQLITLDPGHFHAALFQREMLPGVGETVYIYAPPGPDLEAHLNRVKQFNLRRENPTSWQSEVCTTPDYFERMLKERRGNVVVLSGNNQWKIDRLETSVRAGLNVLADKPWIIEPEAMPKLQAALDAADQRRVIAYDAMTERFEISGMLQRELVNDRDLFGEPLRGTLAEPAVYMESVHHLLKEVGGVPNLRPVWFFDIKQQGEGLADVGTHRVEHAQWTLFPDQAIDYRREIDVLRGTRWPTVMSRAQFQRVTGAKDFPDFLPAAAQSGQLDYFCNNSVSYTLRGIHVKLDIQWAYEAPPGGKDTHSAVFRGSRSSIEVRQGKEQNFQPEVFVVPADAGDRAALRATLQRRIAALQPSYPGLAIEEKPGGWQMTIPAALRTGHETHFSLVGRRFLAYVQDPSSLPAWEKPNMLAKYHVTTRGVELARQAGATIANRHE